MGTNNTLTHGEKKAVIKDATEWCTTVLYNALTYVGSTKMTCWANVTGPDGKQYLISFKPIEDAQKDDNIRKHQVQGTGEAAVQTNTEATAGDAAEEA